jgi:thiopeptide-type bacteriocin biosynthesis protein
LLRDGAIWRLVTDTYDRELERYGGVSGIELVEQVFWLDSEACVEALCGLQGDAGAELRWLVALRGADQLLADLGFDPTRRVQFYTRAQDELDREHRADADLHRRLGKLFRSRQADIERILRPSLEETLEEADPLNLAICAFTRRSSRLAPIAVELAARDMAGKLQPRLGAFAWSLVHMHVNRFLSSAQRSQELVLSNLLRRYHAAQRARQARNHEPQQSTRSAADDDSLRPSA